MTSYILLFRRDEKALPCHLVIERNDSNISTIRDCANDRGSFQLGDKLLYKWECNSGIFLLKPARSCQTLNS